MKKWKIAFSFLTIVNIAAFLIYVLNSTPVQAGVLTTVHIASICGNGIVEPGEDCDGANLNGKTCVTLGLGFIGGTLSCKVDCTFNTTACTLPAPPPPGGGGGGGGGGGAAETRVILQGRAYPYAKVTVLYDGKVATDVKADAAANFKSEITTLTAGVYNFGLWAEDKAGRRSITFTFTVTVSGGMTTMISGIFLPPTIELSSVNLNRGDALNILGQAAPQSEITISVESPQEIVKTTSANDQGEWLYKFDTSGLDEGMHTTRAKAETLDDLLSSYSRVLAFYLGKYGTKEVCPKADFNKDGKTNLIDFSVMLYWWGNYNPCVDQNMDGIVNLPDFSILMYWWTG